MQTNSPGQRRFSLLPFKASGAFVFRRLLRNKLYSFLNISGLALGIAAFLLILQYVSFERSVNGFHKNLAQTYRLLNQDVKGITWGEVEPGWAQKAKDAVPEIKDYCRFESDAAKGVVRREEAGGEPFREEKIGYAEGNFFSFFSFPVLKGTAAAFAQPNIVFLSQPAAKKYFGNEEALGKQLTLFNQFGKTIYTVGGVYSIPVNSDIQYDLVFSLETLKNPANLNDNGWAALDNLSSQYLNTFFLLAPGANAQALQTKLTGLRNRLKEDKDGVVFRLQPFSEVHLPSSLASTYTTQGNLKYIYILSIIAMLILAIAWFNYVNLSTAQSLKRAHEVGVRKVMGASRGSLVQQFLTECLLVNFFALVLAVVIVQISQPAFNQLVEKELSMSILLQGGWLWGLGLLFVGSLLSGAYTAFSLSGFNPVQTLKGKLTRNGRGAGLRKSLVVVQFSISLLLLLATFVIYRQLKFMQSQNLGVTTEQVLVVRGPAVGRDSSYKERKSSFWNEVAQQSFIKEASQSGVVPGGGFNFMTSGFTQPGSQKGDEFKTFGFAIIDSRYLNTYNLSLAAGRNFRPAETAVEWNDNSKVLLNEKAVQELGFKSADDALKSKIRWDERYLDVVGVVKDYHHQGLQKAVSPMIFYPQNNSAYFSLRLQSADWQNSISRLEKLYKQWFPNNPFEYFFADEHFNQQYLTEQQYSRLFTTATLWAVVIACLGLFGLATYTVEQRTKEIGIRKVLGASVASITQLLSKDFIKLIFLSVIIASPLAWWGLDKWLQNFAYRVTIEWWLFGIAGALLLVVALFTVGFQSVKAAIVNPVKTLRSE